MRRGLVTSAVLLGALGLVAGCDSDSGEADGSHEVEVRGARVGFVIEVPREWGITEVDDDRVCGSVWYRLGDLRIEAVPTTCEEATANDAQIGNGYHGVFRTLADVPEPRGVEEVATGLGPASVFTQEYYECTNECDEWDEPVAIVTLDEPVDPGYPTLVVRAYHDDLSRSRLEDMVGSLEAPYVPESS